MVEYAPRVQHRTARPVVSLVEAEAVDAHRTALRHWRAVKLDLARLEREPATMQPRLYATRGAEVRAAERTRETRRDLDDALLDAG